VPAPGESLVRVKLAALCNTDLEIIRGYKKFQGILGHEFVGEVEESGNSALVGKRVGGDINIGCGACLLCKRGLKNHCPHRRVPGIQDKDGTFAEYITLPEQNLYPVPDRVADEEAVLAEPLAAALEVTSQVHLHPASRVAVIGDGKLSYLVTQVLSLTGCDLTVVGKHRDKMAGLREFARTAFLEEVKISPRFDTIVECTGNEQGLQLAGELVRPRGTIVLKSTYAGEPKINPAAWVVKEITLVGSRCGPLDGALRLLEKKQVHVHPLLGRRYSLADYRTAFSTRHQLKPVFDPIL